MADTLILVGDEAGRQLLGWGLRSSPRLGIAFDSAEQIRRSQMQIVTPIGWGAWILTCLTDSSEAWPGQANEHASRFAQAKGEGGRSAMP
jgi:hypothetical protein